MVIALKQIQHTVQIDCFPDVNLIFRLGHVIEQKFQNHGAAKPAAFDFEIGKAHGEVNISNILNADKARIGHGFGEPIPFIAAGSGAMVIFAVFSQILAADSFIAILPVGAAEPAAFVTQEFHLVLLGICQGVQFVKGLVQPKIRDSIAEILPVHFAQELPKIGQHLCGGRYKIEVGIMTFQIFQQQIGMDNDAIPALLVKQGAEAIALFIRKVLLPEQGVAESQSGGYAVFPRQCQNFSGVIVSKPDATPAPDAVRRCAVDGADITPVVEILPVFPEKGQKDAVKLIKLEQAGKMIMRDAVLNVFHSLIGYVPSVGSAVSSESSAVMRSTARDRFVSVNSQFSIIRSSSGRSDSRADAHRRT